MCKLQLSALYAYGQIEIYADVKDNDTLQKLITVFKEQIAKVHSENFINLPVSEYKGKGFYFANTAVKNQHVKPVTKLLAAGVEAFSINADKNTVQLLGNSNMALGHALFSYLNFLGFRFYFANKDWHIIPEEINLFPNLNIISFPAFNHRQIFYGYGTGSKIADDDFNFWVLANKMGGAMNAYFGENYGNIIARNREIFLKHPEWFYPVAAKGTIPDNGKFDMTKEDLIQYILQDTEKGIEIAKKNKTNAYKMISMSPSDGLGTCNTSACQKLGTTTDRVYYLVNRVAREIKKKYPETLVGCLAYSEYITPPTNKVEPNVFVAITTAFNNSKYTVPQLVDEWRKKGARIGIYDYFAEYGWDFDIPGQSVASNPANVIKSIRKYYTKGVTAYTGESTIGWISKGLGYYQAAQQMWDVNINEDASKEEFFNLCFKKASKSMQLLWKEWENYSFSFVRESNLAVWIEYVLAAEKIEKNEEVAKRLFQIKSYLHYLYLFKIYKSSKSEADLLTLLTFCNRKLDDGSIAGYPAFFELGNRSGIPGMGYVADAKWRTNNNPVTQKEISQLIIQDRVRLKISDQVTKFGFSEKFKNIPDIKKYKKLIADSSGVDNAFWQTNEWLLEIKNKGAFNYFDFTGDYIGDKTNSTPIKINVYKYSADGKVLSTPSLFYYEYNATKVKERISLSQLSAGYYTIIIEDPVKIFRLTFSDKVNFSMVMRPDRQIKSTVVNYAFIYIPEGVKKFNILKTRVVDFITPAGRHVSLSNDKAEDLQVEVQKGETGLWRIKLLADQLFIEGIPPYLSTSANQMLIPAGVK